MKSLAMFIAFNFLISFAFSTSFTSSLNFKSEFESESGPNCENKCLACQSAVYSLKFYGKADCKSNHCRSTVISN
jgi:hypothetical protein